MYPSSLIRLGTALLLVGGLALFSARACAQVPAFEEPAWPALSEANAAPSSNRVPHLRLFRIAPGFLADPLGMQDDDLGLPGVPTMPGSISGAAESNGGPDWLQVGMGLDNPSFDLRRPGDPGGVGYYRVNTQVALLDSPTTTCSLGIQAVTPAGAQFAGLPNGPTVLSPTFSVFHAVNDRLALQGFVSRNLPISDAASAGLLQRNVQYGLALQRPLFSEGPEGLRDLFVTVGALGQVTPERDAFRLASNYDVLPGLMWHLNENWWVSSGLLLPVGPVRTAPGQWQLTCSLRF